MMTSCDIVFFVAFLTCSFNAEFLNYKTYKALALIKKKKVIIDLGLRPIIVFVSFNFVLFKMLLCILSALFRGTAALKTTYSLIKSCHDHDGCISTEDKCKETRVVITYMSTLITLDGDN